MSSLMWNGVGRCCAIVLVGRRRVIARPISIMVVLERFFVVRFNLFWWRCYIFVWQIGRSIFIFCRLISSSIKFAVVGENCFASSTIVTLEGEVAHPGWYIVRYRVVSGETPVALVCSPVPLVKRSNTSLLISTVGMLKSDFLHVWYTYTICLFDL